MLERERERVAVAVKQSCAFGPGRPLAVFVKEETWAL